MAASFGWGFLAASSLILGGAIALAWRINERALGLVMAFGSGVLISAVAFELVEEAFNTTVEGGVGLGLAAGSAVFFVGDLLIDRMGGADRKHCRRKAGRRARDRPRDHPGRDPRVDRARTDHRGGAVSAAFLAAVFISNLPEAVAATTGLAAGRLERRDASSGSGSWSPSFRAVGAVRLQRVRRGAPTALAFVLSFAAGAILTMLADTMMPEAFEHGGKLVGVVTTVGFGLAFGLSAHRVAREGFLRSG